MARMKGIPGPLSGTVGTVVLSNWNEIPFVRSKTGPRKSPPSEKQLVQQARFARAVRFVTALKGLFQVTFGDFANKMTGANSALSHLLKNAISGTYPDFQLNYDQALVARGSLPNAPVPTCSATSPGLLGFTWKDNSGVGIARPDDRTVLVAYCEELNYGLYSIGAYDRSSGAGILEVPDLSGRQVQTWIAFLSKNKKEVATSLYTGVVSVG